MCAHICAQHSQSKTVTRCQTKYLSHINCRPEFKWEHLLSVTLKETDINCCQIDKALLTRCAKSEGKQGRGEKRPLQKEPARHRRP